MQRPLGQTEEAEMSEKNELFQSFAKEQNEGSKMPEQIFQEHSKVQEVEEEMEEQLQYVPGEVEDEISHKEQDYVSQNEASEEEVQDELMQGQNQQRLVEEGRREKKANHLFSSRISKKVEEPSGSKKQSERSAKSGRRRVEKNAIESME